MWMGLACATSYLCDDAAFAQASKNATLSLTDWQVAGDGSTDDTVAIQTAINRAIELGATLLVPLGPRGGCYSSGNLLIQNAAGVTIKGTGGKICWRGRGPGNTRIGLQYAGTIANVTIEGLELSGAGPDEAYHAGLWSYSGTTIKNLTVRNNYVHDVSLGLSVGGNPVDGFLVEGNHVENIIGTTSGNGYGIHVENDSTLPSNGRIIGNLIIGAQRHSIYQSKGSGVVIADNTIKNHAIGRPTPGSALSAIVVARSSDITVIGNMVDGATDGSITVDTDKHNIIKNITVVGNTFSNPLGLFPMATIGTVDPKNDGVPESVSFVGNTFYESGAHNVTISINCGKHLSFAGNTIKILKADGNVSALQVRGNEESSGTANYTDGLYFSANDIQITTAKGAAQLWEFLPAAATSRIRVGIAANSTHVPGQAFLFSAAQTDPNILVVNDDSSGASAPLLKAASTQANAHSSALVRLNASAPATVPGCSPDLVTFDIHGAQPGDTVQVAPTSPIRPNFTISAFVSAPGAISIRWCQLIGRPTDPDGLGEPYRIDLWKN